MIWVVVCIGIKWERCSGVPYGFIVVSVGVRQVRCGVEVRDVNLVKD